LSRLPEIKQSDWLLLVEGESDTWTCAHYGIPALGIPGTSTWRSAWAECLEGISDIYVWKEPDQAGARLVEAIAKDIPNLKIISPPEGTKDISEAHIQGVDVVALIDQLKAGAVPVAQILRELADLFEEFRATFIIKKNGSQCLLWL